jgi:hypothetical protein
MISTEARKHRMPTTDVIIILVAASLDIIWLLVALRRHGWGLALIGSLGSIVCFPLSEVIAIILIASSKRQFVKG